jgi:uncharacterized membrane protein
VLLAGTGFGSFFYLRSANRSGSVAAIAFVTRAVVRADWWFTTPAGIIQPLTGFWLLMEAGYPLHATWIWLSLALYVLAGLCWVPVLCYQLHMARMAAEADRQGQALPDLYWHYARRWEGLGYPAFGAMLLIYGLMVMKPT